ncbi:MAG: biotin/lipoyl-containing protein [Gaiellaceae bacterium]
MSTKPTPIGRIEVPLVNPNEPEVQVIGVAVEPYSRIAKGDLVCTVETSKATVDVESDYEGWVGEVRVATNQRATVGDLVCEVYDAPPERGSDPGASGVSEARAVGVRLTRKAEKLALEEGIDLTTLPTGRFLTEKDIEEVIARGREPGDIDPALAGRVHENAVVVYGAGGLAKSLVDLMRADGAVEPICALNDRPGRVADVLGVPVVGGREYLAPLRELGVRYAVNAIGAVRRIEDRIAIFELLEGEGFEQPTLVDPAAYVAPSATLSPGAQVFAGAAVCSAAWIGRGVIVNTNAVVSHDCRVEDFSHIAPGALLAGEVEVGRATLIGMGVTTTVYLKIGASVIVGNGAVLNEDVPDGTIVHAGGVWPRQQAAATPGPTGRTPSRGVGSTDSTVEGVRMYARVARFEGRDMSRVDELVGIVRERLSSGEELPGAKRFLILADRRSGTSLGIVFFESEEAIRAAEPLFEQMGDEIPEEVRGRRTSVDIYEVAIDEIGDGGKAGRVSLLDGPPEGIDAGLRDVEDNILPKLRDISGWRGITTLIDRQIGRALTITFWDSDESLRGSEEIANQLRKEAAEAGGETITGVERYEIVLNEIPVAV